MQFLHSHGVLMFTHLISHLLTTSSHPLPTGYIHSRAGRGNGQYPLDHCWARLDLQAAGRDGQGARGASCQVRCLVPFMLSDGVTLTVSMLCNFMCLCLNKYTRRTCTQYILRYRGYILFGVTIVAEDIWGAYLPRRCGISDLYHMTAAL